MDSVHKLLIRYIEVHGLEKMQSLSKKFVKYKVEDRWKCLAELDNGPLEEKVEVIKNDTRVSRKRKSCYKCESCGEDDVVNSQLQTRGADESMTSFFYCRSCHNRWKEC